MVVAVSSRIAVYPAYYSFLKIGQMNGPVADRDLDVASILRADNVPSG